MPFPTSKMFSDIIFDSGESNQVEGYVTNFGNKH